MKSIFAIAFAFFALSACGSAEQLVDSLDKLSATPVPTAQPGIVWTATPLPAYPRSMYDDYKKIAEGMKREEVISILGDFHKRETKTFCNGGKCEEYEYLSWLYKEGRIGVTIQAGVATFTYAN
jgi:hypothetical protein